jgi:phosphatidylethanolamine/phosphatidyl-N-methylethanolamine N-methyltransferase
LIEQVNNAPRGKVLEVGIGNGSHLPLYSNHHITGIDISDAMLANAQRYKTENVELLIMDGENLLFTDSSFDYVVMCHVLAVTNNAEQLLEQAYRVLKPGGKLYILNHFTPGNWLSYVDRAFDRLSSIFHFKSCFYLDNITGLKRFSLLRQMDLGRHSYYKLLIFCKR